MGSNDAKLSMQSDHVLQFPNTDDSISMEKQGDAEITSFYPVFFHAGWVKQQLSSHTGSPCHLSVIASSRILNFMLWIYAVHEMCCSWTGLTLHEDCSLSRMHLPVAHQSHSTLSPAVGFYQLLASQLTLGGSGRGSGCWCTEVRSRILLVQPLIWHRSLLPPQIPAPASTQVSFCPR